MRLNKRTISKYQTAKVKGQGCSHDPFSCHVIIQTVTEGVTFIYSLFADCDPTFDSCACQDTVNDETCRCTVA
ncbi:hypothetical protein [Kordia sp.]|uniref:hypothetical protein n=1 Tax=Kordia sp. TaxID=1965332 RepID=UPI0025C51A7C|nr:hypothetical protein [Kordia sp.]MCH2194716.1 hypothetical protein [Kordia sp.]